MIEEDVSDVEDLNSGEKTDRVDLVMLFRGPNQATDISKQLIINRRMETFLTLADSVIGFRPPLMTFDCCATCELQTILKLNVVIGVYVSVL